MVRVLGAFTEAGALVCLAGCEGRTARGTQRRRTLLHIVQANPRKPPQNLLDVSLELRRLMGRADGRAARTLLSGRAPALRRAWGEMQAAVSKKSPVARGVELSEDQVGLVAWLMTTHG